MKYLKFKQDEREQSNQTSGARYAFMSIIFPVIILTVFLAGNGEMSAFFSIMALYVAQALSWIIISNIMNHLIYDTTALITIGTSITSSIFIFLAFYLLRNVTLLYLLFLPLILILFGSYHLYRMNKTFNAEK